MIYKSSIASFDSTFAVKDNGSKLTHFSGKRFKLFPYIANNNSEPVRNLDTLVGRYLSQIENKDPEPITADDLIARLKVKTEIEPGMDEIFEQVVRHMFFGRDGELRPINLRMLSQIPCTESTECKVADYLFDVLGDHDCLRTHLLKAVDSMNNQSNVLEKFAASELRIKESSRRLENEYQRITFAIKEKYEEDFGFVLGARNRTRDYLIPLLEFYYFSYTAQAILQLSRFMSAERDKCIPLYFCVEWEKTSQNRACYLYGWNLLQKEIKKIFAHAIVLEILNQTEEGSDSVDYIKIQELVNSAPGEDHRIAEEISILTNRYRQAIQDCTEMTDLQRNQSGAGETADEISFLFESVKCQFENTVRGRPYSSYAAKFEEYSKKYLKNRGRSGMMLNLTEETLIFLTKICIKDQDRMRLTDVFSELEMRGVFLDDHSKSEVMKYYEKLNLIEKKSDSGDAQYVKRIL